ncbi:hypothetical protein Tsubulata_007223 [Turnera subulata]|uniref:AAA+ ATPase domain-containing protein n=1 Tax=Turnera subulata TaxID=218843 RepID=A0A9Q0J258_9ROSI|nr:hypothetical protein Tsubulata_007223 [Turnera subulata]
MMWDWETWSSALYSLIMMSCFSSCQKLIPEVFDYVARPFRRLINYFNQTMEIRFHEYPDGVRFRRNKAYADIEAYLSSKCTAQATLLKAELIKKSRSIVYTVDAGEQITDSLNGVKVRWESWSIAPKTKCISKYPAPANKYYSITFPMKHKNYVLDQYLKHVVQQGKAIRSKNRQRRLFTNIPSENWWDYTSNLWSHVVFDHPATFETVAIDPKTKEEIMAELQRFTAGKDYYAKIGKAWKRGYLLYGPPGTGKSSLIAAIANFMGYDVYDIELTAVNDNTELRALLTDISSKSVVVIEDIDCSLDLTGQRSKQAKKDEDDDLVEEKKDKEKDDEDNKSKVTLSGLLNFIDGLWSSSGGERIIIFTTNHKEKLDPALIRRGRMDRHIELSYCKFEAFKILTKNYLDIDSHDLFDRIGQLLDEVNMTPADVVEHLMPKTPDGDAQTSLESLIQALEIAKEAQKLAAVKEEEKKQGTKEAERKKELKKRSPAPKKTSIKSG